MDRDAIFEKIRAVGRAALTVDIENSHSGNISMRYTGADGADMFAITATGSQKGELTPDKICHLTLNETNYGYFKASSETDIHARILQIPGIGATMHGHTRAATIVTLDDDAMPKTNPRAALVPVDPLGARYLGAVPVDWIEVASGSKEMTKTIFSRLSAGPVCMIQSHGAFAGGASLEETLFYLCALEHAGEVLLYAGMLGLDPSGAKETVEALAPGFAESMPAYTNEQDGLRQFDDEPDTVDMFLSTGARIFQSRYSPFHSGSMSLRGAETMLYLPKASLPADLPGPMLEVPLLSDSQTAGAASDIDIHRLIYRETPLKSVLHCHLSEAQAMVLALLPEAMAGHARVIPIDVEGGFLYPAVPVLPPNPDAETLCRALLDYHIVIVAFGGVWSAGEQSVGEALRHVSSVKDICRYRINAAMRGLDVASMEPKRAGAW